MRKVSILAGETSEFRRPSKGNIKNKNSKYNYDVDNSTTNTHKNIIQIALEPTIKLLKNTGFPRNLIDAVIFSSCDPSQYLSSIIAEILGIRPKISHRLDNLCNSGTNAIISAFSYISAGLCDSALVIGAEMADSPGKILQSDFSRGQFALPVYWGAIFKKMHMKKYGTKEEQICMIPVNNYSKARNNSNAINKGKEITLTEVMNSKMVVEPLRLLECCSICEGASSILLVADEKIPFFTSKLFSNDNLQGTENSFFGGNSFHNSNKIRENIVAKKTLIPVSIRGIGQQTTSASFSNAVEENFRSSPAKIAAQNAYDMAKLTPNHIDVVELHDAFSILEIMAYEDLGFAAKGQGGKFIEKQESNMYVNPSGGIIGCGHALGATGIAQTVEIFKQLSGKIDDDIDLSYNNRIHIHETDFRDNSYAYNTPKVKRQNNISRQIRSYIKFGLIHNLAAAGTSASVLILEK
ncbi:MAG TPA: thiolase family protein [Nitrososphaeraceae archaeon]|nr:thiolase family protein [Nitrososphaeraceae archaeon]